jgi:hypothetical protein
MAPLIPIETLSYYLSKTGFPKFRQWFKSVELLSPIHNDLENLTYITENSTWLEDKLRKETLIKSKSLILKHIETVIGTNPEKYFQNWIDSIQPYCFQGGYGHRIQYSGNIPHHWCVSCENYEKVKNIPKNLALCGIVCDKYVNLSEKPETMHWS